MSTIEEARRLANLSEPDFNKQFISFIQGLSGDNKELEAERVMINDFLAIYTTGKIPVDPQLPENWDNWDIEDRPNYHGLLWGLPYIVTQANEHWPNGIRFDVRCLDGGAWDRSTNRGQFATLEEAIQRANELKPAGGRGEAGNAHQNDSLPTIGGGGDTGETDPDPYEQDQC